MASDQRVTMVIDCDAGVDDATAIMMALARPNVDLIAVTCVKGNTDLDNVTINVLRVLRTCDRLDIPVYRGANQDLLGTTPPRTCRTIHGKDGLGDIVDPEGLPNTALIQSEHAATALIRLAKERPQQITLVAIGPLTNVALAMRLDPEFTSNLKEMVVMGGNILGRGTSLPASEFNFWADPTSAHIVLSDTQCPTIVVPLETCQVHAIKMDWFSELQLLPSPRAKFLSAINALPMKVDISAGNTTRIVADSCAIVVAATRSSVLESTLTTCKVELRDGTTKGQLITAKVGRSSRVPAFPGPEIEVVQKIDQEIIYDMLNAAVR